MKVLIKIKKFIAEKQKGKVKNVSLKELSEFVDNDIFMEDTVKEQNTGFQFGDVLSEKQREYWYNLYMDAREFEVKQAHIELIKRINWRFFNWGDWVGGLVQDGKRPYGNSDIDYDVWEITNLFKYKDNDNGFTQKQEELLWKVHCEVYVAIQILTQDLKIELGIYTKGGVCQKWIKQL